MIATVKIIPFAVDAEPLLVDMTYLTELFRRELTDAVARILETHEEPLAKVAVARV